ncbi:MAG: hypothetical protein FJX75_11785 [Armatimonadetes bacterium]|nr:hypothetical protein [Armatimonadota bacterium]
MRALPLVAIAAVCVAVSLFLVAHGAPKAQAGTPRFHTVYCTLLGGSGWDQAREVIPYADGSVLVGAQTMSADMPVTEGVLQPKYAGDDPKLGNPGIYGGDCFLARLAPDGKSLVWGTYFGGSKQERNTYGLLLDPDGNIVVATNSRSPDVPTTPGCFQAKYGGGDSDTVIAKLSPDGKRLLWCTYIGGSRGDSPRGGLAIDETGNVLVVGTSDSPDFPTTPGVIQPALNGPRDSTIAKLKADGSGLVFATYLGGTGEDDAIMGVRIDAAGCLYVAGHTKSADFPVTPGAAQGRAGGQSDCYLAKLTPDASRLLYATYLGGSGNEFAEHRPWLFPEGDLLLAGWNGSADFPTTPGAFQPARRGPGDGFLTRLSADGTRFVFSTLLGGSAGENLLMPTPDAEGNLWVVGSTGSSDLAVTPDALQSTFGGGKEDGLLAAFSPDASGLIYCSYVGGSGEEMIRSLAFGPKGEMYLVGNTSSPDFQTTPGALRGKPADAAGDAFVVKLNRSR